MKKTIAYMWVLLIMGALACRQERKGEKLAEPVPLRMSINSDDLVMGETLDLTFEVVDIEEQKLVANEDIPIKLRVQTGGKDVEQLLFDNFPSTVIFPKGERKLKLNIPIKKTGLNKTWQVDFKAFARGYKLDNGLKALSVSDYHYTRIFIKNNPDNTLKEGTSFSLVAQVNSTLKQDLTIHIGADEAMRNRFEHLPEEIVIPKGQNSVELSDIVVKKSTETTEDEQIALTFSIDEAQTSRYPLRNKELVINRLDIHKALDPLPVRDERYLYEDADQMFVSSRHEADVKAWGQSNYRIMNEGDPHPNNGNILPAGKWKFYRAYEFHKIPKLLRSEKSPMGDYTSQEYPLGFANHSTGAVETAGAVDNAKYSYVTDEGHLRMMTLKEPAKSGRTGEVKDFGTSALNSNQFRRDNPVFSTYPTASLRIYPGMRIETRARIRGTLDTGMLPGIWLQGNEQVSGNPEWNHWPDYGEIDVMESNSLKNENRLKYAVEQSWHVGNTQPNTATKGHPHSIVGVPELARGRVEGRETIIDDFQIYWFEWRSNTEVAVGTNGKEVYKITPADIESRGGRWPFTTEVNTEGMYYILTMMFLGKVAPKHNGTDMKTSHEGARNILKFATEPRTVKIPRMEVDWVRFYIDDTYMNFLGDKPFRKDVLLY